MLFRSSDAKCPAGGLPFRGYPGHPISQDLHGEGPTFASSGFPRFCRLQSGEHSALLAGCQARDSPVTLRRRISPVLPTRPHAPLPPPQTLTAAGQSHGGLVAVFMLWPPLPYVYLNQPSAACWAAFSANSRKNGSNISSSARFRAFTASSKSP